MKNKIVQSFTPQTSFLAHSLSFFLHARNKKKQTSTSGKIHNQNGCLNGDNVSNYHESLYLWTLLASTFDA
jgi:hypothetical protein